MRKRVVVTGVGSVNPMGHNVEEVWSGLKEGKSGVGFTTIFDASKFSTKISAEVKNCDASRAGLETRNPLAEIEQEPNMPAGYIAGMFNAEGPNANCLTACAASSQAVSEATEIIRRGDADVMLSGGAHSMIHPFGVTGFNLLTALSVSNEEPTKASRPFDRLRDGFVLGEGGAMVVLEELEHAKKRGAPILGEVLGYGTTADAYRITDIHPEGRGAIVCLLAIRDNVLPPTINYENPDPDCDLDYIPNAAREARCDFALSNSFGFGGQNISLVVGRFRD